MINLLLGKLKIRTKLLMLIGLFIVLFSTFTVYYYDTFNAVKVQGRYYNEIVQGKDLIADVLPPPELIIESYLVVLEMGDETDKAKLDAQVVRLKKLKEEYFARHNYWDNALPKGELKNALTVDAHKSAVEFYDALEKQWIPAFESGDRAAARTISLGVLKNKFEEQRRHVDRVVVMATDMNTKVEANTTQMVSNRLTIIVAMSLIAVALILVLGVSLSNSISNPLRQGVDLAKLLEAGDLTGKVDVKTKDETGQLGTALNASLKSLNELIGQSTMTVEQVVSGTQQIASAAESLSQGASEQAGALEEITSSITELSAQTKQAAVNSESANALAKKVMTSAGEGNERMREMVGAMEEINKASSNIAKIMKAIDEIAFQTNLLALNAAVEAARAGKYGKGFAVVAEEVRNLATRSAASAKETSEIIELSINKIQAGSAMARETLKSFQEIVEGINQSVRLIGEITVSSNDQVQGIVQVEQALQQIDVVTQQNASNAEESAAASSELAGQADLLSGMLKKFKLAAGAINGRGNGHGEHAAGATNGKHGPARTSHLKLAAHTDQPGGAAGHGPGNGSHSALANKNKPATVISLEDNDFSGL